MRSRVGLVVLVCWGVVAACSGGVPSPDAGDLIVENSRRCGDCGRQLRISDTEWSACDPSPSLYPCPTAAPVCMAGGVCVGAGEPDAGVSEVQTARVVNVQNCLNLRASCGVSAAVITCMPGGSVVDVVGGPDCENWYQVVYHAPGGDETGWCSGNYLEFL